MHNSGPWLVFTLPGLHITQVPPFGPENPLLHRHSDASTLPCGDHEFAGQLRHSERADAEREDPYVPFGQRSHPSDPTDCLYEPIGHAAQSCPSSPVKPLLHVQLSTLVLPSASEKEKEGHGAHESAEPWATSDEKVPGGHRVQLPAPAPSLYVPAAHGIQGPPSSPKNPSSHTQGPGPGSVFTAPTGQMTQGPPSGPKEPAVNSDLPSQEHCVRLTLPGDDTLLAGQL